MKNQLQIQPEDSQKEKLLTLLIKIFRMTMIA